MNNPLFGISGFKHFTFMSSFKEKYDSLNVVH